MNVEGKLTITLSAAGDGHAVDIASTRPLHAVRLFLGKTPEQVLATLPLLYSVCATAQACAAQRACATALGSAADPALDAAQTMLVWTESAREHLWRVLLDWPGLLGEAVDRAGVKPLMQLLPRMRAALFGAGEPFALAPSLGRAPDTAAAVIDELETVLHEQVFGVPAGTWLEEDPATWVARGATPAARLLGHVQARGWERLGHGAVEFLPPLPAARLDEALAGPGFLDFVAAPTWDGTARETTPLARQAAEPGVAALRQRLGNGLYTRLAARLVELARIPGLLRGHLAAVAAGSGRDTLGGTAHGSGLGQVEAARGRLVHRVALEDGRVGAYAILAPTEWNFHPDGTVARGLAALPPTDETTLRAQAALLIQAVDPCVSYELEFNAQC